MKLPISFIDLGTKNFLVGLPHVVVKNFTFSDGTTIPQGTTVCVSNFNVHLNDQVYEDPSKFDGFRFSEMREGSAKKVGMVSLSLDYLPFGHGRYTCPGPFRVVRVVRNNFSISFTTFLEIHIQANEDVIQVICKVTAAPE